MVCNIIQDEMHQLLTVTTVPRTWQPASSYKGFKVEILLAKMWGKKSIEPLVSVSG